jgi:hypothetical protein
MPLEQPVVPADSTPANAVNDNQVEQTTQENSASSETTEQSQEVAQESTPTVAPINADLYDERGVPWKNVAMEQRRKYEETQANLPKLVAEEIAKTTQQQKPKYTIAELEQFAQTNPEHRAWVEQEKATLLKSEISQELEQRIEQTAKQAKDEAVRAQVFNKVLSTFPDIAIKDQQGNFMGWNNINPMTQLIGRYMSNPEIASRPDGLEIASKLAYADTMLSKTPQTQKTIQSMKSQVKKLQAQTFVEGGGRKPSEGVSPTKKHIERVASSGRSEDAAGVFREIHKQMGMTKE